MDHGLVSDTVGNVISFDGRLDNARELANLLGLVADDASDSEIALAGYLRWEDACFSRFTGDWAVALWSARKARMILARDHAGMRTLYFSQRKAGLLWSTYLDTFQPPSFECQLSECYAASYLACIPVGNRTPYEDLLSVRPGHYMIFADGFTAEGQHWSPLVGASIRYGSEKEYDEQFLSLFGQSVARRTGLGAPILAHLSGGMDSTSIVCMSDHLRRSVNPDACLLDTLSFYDDSESSLDERSYFTITETQRGKTGIHLNTAMALRTFEPVSGDDAGYCSPGGDSCSLAQEQRLLRLVWQEGYRAILSGIGGDEVLGGVPTGLPELADVLRTGDMRKLIQRSIEWCLPEHTPLLCSLRDTAHYAFRLYTTGSASEQKVPPWLSKRLSGLAQHRDSGEKTLLERLRSAPHQLDNAETWGLVMETLPHTRPQLLFRPEYRYPMLDKDLIEFLFSIPREELVRPGRRRLLMRRALRGIVPDEILERRRKGYQLSAPLRSLQQAQDKLRHFWKSPLLADEGFIEVEILRREFDRCVQGEAEWSGAIFRTIAYELWLRTRSTERPSAPPASFHRESDAFRPADRPTSSVRTGFGSSVTEIRTKAR
jgi:asparagine synthase (glutamine-hydrolysing)